MSNFRIDENIFLQNIAISSVWDHLPGGFCGFEKSSFVVELLHREFPLKSVNLYGNTMNIQRLISPHRVNINFWKCAYSQFLRCSTRWNLQIWKILHRSWDIALRRFSVFIWRRIYFIGKCEITREVLSGISSITNSFKVLRSSTRSTFQIWKISLWWWDNPLTNFVHCVQRTGYRVQISSHYNL